MNTKKGRRKVHNVPVIDNSNNYTHDVSFYSNFPLGDVSLEHFQDLALERLQLLRFIEQASLRGHKLYSDDWRNAIKDDLNKAHLKKYARLMSGFNSQSEQDVQARRADHISHHILRLVYCKSQDLRRWFLSREVEWFRLKFQVQSPEAIKQFLHDNGLVYIPISEEEKNDLMEDLVRSTVGLTDVMCNAMDFYKVPILEVASLVRGLKVFVRSGFAFIPSSELVVVVQSRFRVILSEGLNICNHRVNLLDDERIFYIMHNLPNAYTGKDYTYSERESKGDNIHPSNLDAYSRIHYPLCMRHIHDILKADHHLKHDCRLQYGLFIKGIGVLYEHAMEFWQQEFTKAGGMDANKFQKEYAYNFKHQYGKVGGMVNYSPYSCMKIIMGNVGSGEHHGCPFRHWDEHVVRQRLQEYGVNAEGIQNIMDLVKNGHYQFACTKYFECVKGQPPSNVISHPNQYFDESMKLAKEKEKDNLKNKN